MAEVEVQHTSKPITFKASAKTEKLIKEPSDAACSHGLSAYLSLPLDQYSLLDPGWISRCPGSPDMFVLRIPLFDLVGLELQPQISVRVAADPRNGQVHFLADQFKLGDPRFDSDLQLAMRATLRNKPVPTLRPLRSIRRMWSRTRAGRNGKPADSAGGAASGWSGSSAGPSAPDTAREHNGFGTSSDEEGVVVHVEGADGSDGEGADAVRSRDLDYNPAAVLDVGMGCGAGGRHGMPDLPPHVVMGSDRWGTAGATASSWPSATGGSGSTSKGRAGSSNASTSTSTDRTPGTGSADYSRSAEGSSGSRSGYASPPGHQSDFGLAVGGSGRNQVTTSRSGGPLLDGGTRSVVGSLPADTPGWPLQHRGGSTPAASSVVAVTAGAPSTSSNGWQRQPHVAYEPTSRPLQPVSVIVAAAAPASALAPATERAVSPATHAEPLPFIEDSVLYVPASNWGRSAEASPGAEAPGARRSAGPASNGTANPVIPAVTLHPDAPQRDGEAAGPSCSAERAAGARNGLAAHPLPRPASDTPPPCAAAPPAPGGASREGAWSPGACSGGGSAAGARASAGPPFPGLTASAAAEGTDISSSSGTGGRQAFPSLAAAPSGTQASGAVGSSARGSAGSASSTGGGASASASADDNATALLVGSVDVSVTVMVPPALAAVPRPLLGMTGSLIARYAISSLLPSFLDLLAADYGRWSSGQSVSARAAPAGDLAATAAANAAAMGGSAGLAGLQQVQEGIAADTGASSSGADGVRPRQ